MSPNSMLVPIFAAFALLAPSAATAGDNNAAVKACKGKQDGDACVVNTPDQDENGRLTYRSKNASCSPSECCELDYSKGSPPASVCGPCLACEGPPAADAKDPPVSGSAAEPPRTPGSDPPASAGNDKRGCAVGGNDPKAGPLALLLLLGLVSRPTRKTPLRYPTR